MRLALLAACFCSFIGLAACGSTADVDLDSEAQSVSARNISDLRYIAYAYQMTIEAPATALPNLTSDHISACEKAGASRCVIEKISRSENSNWSYATLRLRGEPDWLQGFRNDINRSVKEARGRVTSEDQSADDLTFQFIDTEARLKSLRTTRDRLLALLASKPTQVMDIVAIEQELARLQGDIEALENTLAELERRVSMSKLRIVYREKDFGLLKPFYRLLGQGLDFIF